MILYCGKETKISLNSGKYAYKTSVLEYTLNKAMFLNIIILLSLAGIMSGRLFSWVSTYGPKMKYVYPEKNPNWSSIAGAAYASYYVLFNGIVPLAMLVTLEIAKMSYSDIMEKDAEMMNYG